MIEPQWLLADAVQAIHKMLLAEHGGSEGVRELSLLESALNRASQKLTYNNQTNIFELAAAYSFALVKNHPFVDGNKRTAFVAGVIFLEINGYQFVAAETDSTVMFEGLAAGKISELALALWFEKNSE